MIVTEGKLLRYVESEEYICVSPPALNRPDRSDLRFGPHVVNKIGPRKEELAFGRDYSRSPCVRDNSNTPDTR